MNEGLAPPIESSEPKDLELNKLKEMFISAKDRVPDPALPVIASRQIYDIGQELDEYRKAYAKWLSSDEPKIDVVERSRARYFYHLGLSLLMHQAVEQKVNAVKPEYREPVGKYFDYLELFCNATAATVRIGNMALVDLLDLKRLEQLPDNDPKKLRLLDVYRFLTHAPYVVLSDERVEDHFPENAELAAEFPDLTKESIFTASAIAFYALMFTALDEVQALRTGSEIMRKGVQQVETVLRNVEKIRRRVHEVVFNPESDEFAEFRTEIEKNLAEENLVRLATLHFIVPTNTVKGVWRCYRKSMDKAQKGILPDFYLNLAEKLRVEYDRAGITEGDAQVLANGRDFDNAPSLGEIRRGVIDITEKTKEREFVLDPEAAQEVFSVYHLEVPSSVSIRIDTQNKYRVILQYETETGDEPLSVELYFYKKKDDLQFDWNIFSDPDHKELAGLRNGALTITMAVLARIKSKVDADFQQRKAAKVMLPPPPRPPTPSIKRTREVREATAEPTPKVPRSVEKPLTPFNQALLGALEPQEESKIKIQIVVDKKIEGLSNLSPTDQEIVLDRINEFNKGKRRARFKMVKHVRKEGEPSYSIAVGTTSGQWVRVLLTEDPNETQDNNSGKTRQFKPYRVGYRGSGIYG